MSQPLWDPSRGPFKCRWEMMRASWRTGHRVRDEEEFSKGEAGSVSD